jgi:Holliday junction resolvasome RuvABC endonuclease subunit
MNQPTKTRHVKIVPCAECQPIHGVPPELAAVPLYRPPDISGRLVPSKVIIGLDLATHTGWCILKDGAYLQSGVQDFSKKRGESNGLMFMRYLRWLVDLIDLCKQHGVIELIGYEQAHMRGGAPTEICVGLQTHTMSTAAQRGIESAPVKSTTLKKYATGKGNGDKPLMIMAANRWLSNRGIPARADMTDDEADAIHIARWMHETYGSVTTITQENK